jgi:hypothetical protein
MSQPCKGLSFKSTVRAFLSVMIIVIKKIIHEYVSYQDPSKICPIFSLSVQNTFFWQNLMHPNYI